MKRILLSFGILLLILTGCQNLKISEKPNEISIEKADRMKAQFFKAVEKGKIAEINNLLNQGGKYK